MQQTINTINITGKLVKVGLEKKVGQKGEYIGGDLILRTSDGSEHEVGYYANRFKKDKEGNITSEESSLYKGLETVLNEYKSLEKFPNEADVIKIGVAEFGINDYKGKDGEVKSFNRLSAKFANRVNFQDLETTPQEATFEVQGVITKVSDETYKDQPTGNLKVQVDVFGYEGTIIPITLIVPEAIVEGFSKAGFYETGVAKFSGKIVNTKETKEIIEKQAFGQDIKKIVETTVRRYEITGGTPQGSIYDLKITDEEYEQAKSKRRLKLDEIKNKVATTQQQGFGTAPSQPSANPFGSAPTNPAPNPFANPFAPR